MYRQIFVIARVFDIMHFDMLKNVLIAVIEVARHCQRDLSKLLPIEHLPAQG